jgi:hypothetical protein
LSLPLQLHWQASPLVSGLHAADLLLRKQPLADPTLAAALADPVEKLDLALREDHLPAEKFLSHLLGLAPGINGLTELTEVALTKTIGRTEAAPRMPWYRGLLTDVKNAFTAALPELPANLTRDLEPLRQRWNAEGVAVLAGVVNASEPGILVEDAAVVGVYPAQGGGGAASLPYNVARIELVAGDPVPELPELLRLVWLLSMLNLDLPRYGENIPADRLPLTAGLATVPLTLAAAEGVRLARGDPATVGLAVRTWLAPWGPKEEWAATVNQWWDVYTTMRPPWATALRALDQLLREGESGRA